jgi:4-nitrophenyl phosphatase
MIRLVIFDLDGVIYRGKKLLPYSKKTIKILRKKGIKIFFLTNNSTKTREQYVDKLKNLGIECNINEIMTSAYATKLYFKEKVKKNVNVLIIGGDGIDKELKEIGVKIINSNNLSSRLPKIDYVVVGLDVNFNYQKLIIAQKVIFYGAKFIATNYDPTYPTEKGLLPGGGSIVASIETATNKKPIVIGKPQIYSLKKILDLTKIPSKNSMIVGDRIDTDILVGNKLNLKTVLVLTGVTSRCKLKKVEKDKKPDYVIKNLSSLLKILKLI